MKVLLVEPQKGKKYHTPYPPLGLLKLSSLHKQKGNQVKFVQGLSENGFQPDAIYITSLFTYAYEPVHDAIRYYSEKYKRSKISVGGIYATLCSEHLTEVFGNRIKIHKGLLPEAESLLPDYSLVPEWNASILFSSRGCINSCAFCSVPQIEPKFEAKKTIRHLIYPKHKKAILWDNNILASPYWKDIFGELEESKLEIDFNQGLDARLFNEETVLAIKRLVIPLVRLAYDSDGIAARLEKAINLLKSAGIKGRRIVVYCLYNHLDTPDSFLARVKNLLNWGVVAYPMRYEPLEPNPKNTYISPDWTADELNMIARARRVIGYGGAFPPYEGLKKKILDAKDLREAFSLRPVR